MSTAGNGELALEVRIERFHPADLDQVMEIENRSFTMPWSRRSYEEFWPLESVDMWVARCGEELVGYYLIQTIGDEMEMHTFAVKPECRRRGIGRNLLKHMMEQAARSRVRHVYLQVRPSNHAARHLYVSIGFKTVGIRREYYKDNREDALVMRLAIA